LTQKKQKVKAHFQFPAFRIRCCGHSSLSRSPCGLTFWAAFLSPGQQRMEKLRELKICRASRGTFGDRLAQQ